jgi:hypothetical protein
MKNISDKTPFFELRAIAEDEATGEFTAVVRFRDVTGRLRQIEQPRANLSKPALLREALENAGAALFHTDKENNKAIQAMSASDAKLWKFAASVGWYDGHRAFVHPFGVQGKPRGDGRVFPPRRPQGPGRFELCRQGDLAGWIKSVAKPARHSSSMVLGICMGLAAPLLDFVDLHPFGILLSGPSKSGKSTVLVVSGSVIGISAERCLPNFRATDAALGELPSDFNDMIFPINELGLLKGKAKDRHERMRDLSYGFAEGRGTTYSKRAPANAVPASYAWRGLALASGEETLDEVALAAREIRPTGASIRWMDLPGNKGNDKDVFDRLPKDVHAKTRAAWVGRRCAALRKAVAKHHGVASDHFTGRVIQARREIKGEIDHLIDTFIEDAGEQTDDPAVRHLTRCFGLIRAGGILGVRFGTLPYSEQFVDRCIMRCYRAAKRNLRTESQLLRSAIRRLRSKLTSSKIVKVGVKKPGANAFKSADGYVDRSGENPTVTIRAERFKGWFDDPRQAALILGWLQSRKALPCKPTQPAKWGNAIVWAERQPEWPDGRRPRSVVISLIDGLFDYINV